MGHPDYEVTGGSATFKGENLFDFEPEERAHMGLFLRYVVSLSVAAWHCSIMVLTTTRFQSITFNIPYMCSFQSPVEIPGVSNSDFLRMATNAVRKSKGESELDPLEFFSLVTPKLQALNMDPVFLNRNVNEGFSGGEKKRNEILQLACLEAQCAILDEIDSGLDIDALKDVAQAVNGLKKDQPNMSVLMVTHYKRLLDYIKPDKVHIMQKGQIITTGDMGLVDQLELEGYSALSSNDQ